MKNTLNNVEAKNGINPLLVVVPTHRDMFFISVSNPQGVGRNERSQKWKPANAGFFCGGAEALQPNEWGYMQCEITTNHEAQQ